ncbi:TMF-TATA-bd domain-containing protein [Aphelenchoides besseyi]|nr:TMF-TATA-bd domain-containing protein [Aphelenchoides besseyi]
MSLSWANKLAKNALLNAQKRIDHVLDIKEENSEEQRGYESDGTEPNESIDLNRSRENSSTDGDAANTSHETLLERPIETNDSHLIDVDLSVPESSGWNVSPVGLNDEIVEAEPNPIRDAHDQHGSSLIHYSPSSSNSPDEAEVHQCSTSTSTHFDLSLIHVDAVDSTEHRSLNERSHCDRERHEDVLTVASSDIVVIKNVDDWSVASGSHKRVGSDQISLSASVSNTKNGDDDSLHDKLMTLEAMLKHRDQRIEELSRLNENLKSQNTTLAQRNKQMNNKLTVESKLQKQLTEKDNEMRDLMNEGKNLSVQIAKQTKELKRLRDIEKTYESTNQKLIESTEELKQRTELELQLSGQLKKLQIRLAEKEEEISAVREKIDQKQEVADDLQMSEQRCQNQKMQIAKLEQRIDDLMAAQRASAEQIAFSNAPLLSTIDELENKLRDNEAEKYVLQKKIRFAEENAEATSKKSVDEINNLKQQLTTLRNSNTTAQEKIRRIKSDYDELQDRHNKSKELLASVESSLLSEITALKEAVNKKDEEIAELKHELLVATQPKAPVAVESNSAQIQNDENLLAEIQELERENEGLRQKLQELQHAHDTLLELHGESVVRTQELEQENESIKIVCREQALMVAAMQETSK